MKIIIFVRHGESEINAIHGTSSDINPYKLTEKGVKQVHLVAEELAKTPKIEALYTSPVLRAKRTAEMIGKRCGIIPRVEDRLRERAQGRLNNVTFPTEAEQLEAYKKEIYGGCKDGFESWNSMQSRMHDFVDSINEELAVAVTHSDPIMAIMSILDPKYDDFDFTTKIPMASMTALDFEKRRILCVGSATLPESLKLH